MTKPKSKMRSVLLLAMGGCSFNLACADPCHDDGLAQGGCPADAATDSQSGPSSQSATLSETDSTAMSASGASASQSGSDTDSDSDTSVDETGASECPQLQQILVPQVPTFQIVLDTSASMAFDFDGISRWDAMIDTLVGSNGVVSELQSNIRFGISLYHNPGGTCPTVEEIAPQLDAADEILTLLQASAPEGDTPTGESIDVIAANLKQDAWNGEKYLLLATDGEPDTCAIPDPQTMMETNMVRQTAVDAVAQAFDEDIQTFVISVGDEIAEAHLQELANAGQGVASGDPDAAFYVALDQNALVKAFDDIISGLRSCEIELPSELMTQFVDTCTVTVNNMEYGYDKPNGWRLNDPTHIELVGAACEAIQRGIVAIVMDCTCTSQ